MIRDADSETMVLMLDSQDVAVSIGSSYASHASKPSRVLLAIDRTPRETQSLLLITMGPSTNTSDIDRVIEALLGIVNRLRHLAGVVVDENEHVK